MQDEDKRYQSMISIHAPRVGSDTITEAVAMTQEISIHAPRVGSDGTSSSFLLPE